MSPRSPFGTYLMMEEALVVASVLSDGGFDATVDNYCHASVNPFYIPALGGIRISVPTHQLHNAQQYLHDMQMTAEIRLEEALQEQVFYFIPERIRWGAWTMAVMSLGPLVISTGIALIWLLQTRKVDKYAEDISGKAPN